MLLPSKKLWLPGQAKRNPFRLNPFARAIKDSHDSRAMYRHFSPARVAAESVVRGFAGYPCCCDTLEPGDCNPYCGGDVPVRLHVRIQNIANGTCDCQSINSAGDCDTCADQFGDFSAVCLYLCPTCRWTGDYNGGGDCYTAQTPVPFPYCINGGDAGVYTRLILSREDSTRYATLSITYDGGYQNVFIWENEISLGNCSEVLNGLVLYNIYSTDNVACDWSSSTATLSVCA
jgi:hypothetical protein